MKAIVLSKVGDLSNIKYTEIDKPEVKKGEVLVKIDYCGVNHLDLLIIEGKRQTTSEYPLILGSEIVGRISDTNEKIAVYPWTFCGSCRQCETGNENICDYGGTFGRTSPGGYAEYVSVPSKNIVKIPQNVDPRHICASVLSSITALHMLKRSNIQKNSLVLVNGATGGVGTALIKLLKRKNCRIITSTSHLGKSEKLKKIGAEIIVETKYVKATVEKYFPEGIPFIFDMMGNEVWSESVGILAKNGTMVFCATTLEGKGLVNISQAFSKQVNILGSYGGTVEDLKEVIGLIKSGIIKPVIDSVYQLEDVPEALQKLKDQKAFGKILIKIN